MLRGGDTVMATIMNYIDIQLQATSPRINSSSLPSNITLDDRFGGTGINVCNARWATFKEATLPPNVGAVGATATLDATRSYIGSKCLKMVSSSATGWLYLANGGADYNFSITPYKKWIISAWVYSASTVAIGNLSLIVRTAAGLSGIVTNSAAIPAGTWTRFSGMIDLSAVANTTALIAVQHNATGITVWWDCIMMEYQIGTLTTPSVYHDPNNFLSSMNANYALNGTSNLSGTAGINATNTAGGNALNISGSMATNNSTMVVNLNSNYLNGYADTAFLKLAGAPTTALIPNANAQYLNGLLDTQFFKNTTGTTATVQGYSSGSATATFNAANKPGSNSTNAAWLQIQVGATVFYIPIWN